MAQQSEPHQDVIFEGKHARVVCLNPGKPKLLVAFDHRNRNRDGFSEVDPWNLALKNGHSQLKVQVRENDYYLNDDLPELRRVLFQFTKSYDQVYGLGFSMGGFAAVLLSKALRMNHVLLVSPQRLDFPRSAPFLTDIESEALVFSPGLDRRYEGIRDVMRGVVLYDPYQDQGRDRAYARVLGQLAPKLRLLAMPGAGHPATKIFVEAKAYANFQKTLLDRQSSLSKLKALHRSSRENSPLYLDLLNAYLRRRMK